MNHTQNSFAGDVCAVTAADKEATLGLFRALVGSLQYSFSYLFAKSLPSKDLKTVAAQEGAKSFFDVAQGSIFRYCLVLSCMCQD